MKKRILSLIGAAGVVSMVAIALTFSTPTKSQAASGLATLNIKALTTVSFGACTGPKGASTTNCECTNTRVCSDNTGCNSQDAE